MAKNIFGDKEWLEEVGADDSFGGYITDWIAEAKIGNLTKEDVLKAVAKIAEYRKDSSLMLEVEQRLG